MNYADLTRKVNKVFELVAHGKINDSFDVLRQLVENCKNKDYRNQLEGHFTTYQNLLKYSFELGNDPDKRKVYNRLLKSMVELAELIKEDIVLHNGLISYYHQKAQIECLPEYIEGDPLELLETLSFEKELRDIISKASGIKGTDEKETAYKKSLAYIFKLIWLSDRLTESEIVLIRAICDSLRLSWYDKSLVVSAITLSLLRHFDQNKVILLFELLDARENRVWQRALTGLVICLYYYDARLYLYPEITLRLKSMQGDKLVAGSIESVILQIIKAKETEKITKKIQEDIFPDVMKMKSLLDEKLDLENILSQESIEDQNPEWEEVFKETPDLYAKFEEFSMLQMEGSDVFLSAFALLKRFDFFDEISNWFLPFYKENESLKNALKDVKADTSAFVEGLERSYFLCNSDKYSFCLNIKYMPDLQKSMMMELFNMEMKAMNEMADEDELLNNDVRDKAIFTQYIQDLYRFFKLHPLKKEFVDMFNLKLDIQNTYFFSVLFDDTKILRNIGEFYFQKKYYREAIRIFETLMDPVQDYELLEKTGYAYQLLGEFRQAIDYYHKAELLDQDKPWLKKKIAFCNRKLGNYEKSIEYYQSIEKNEPDNLYIQTNLGHTYMNMGDYETALKYYFKVEYLAPDNYKIQRTIGWCTFVLGKFETAKKYFEKLIARNTNENDFINFGHLEWCMGNKQQAIELYKAGVKKAKNNFEWLSKTFYEDQEYLILHGIDAFDIPLMIDYIKLKI